MMNCKQFRESVDCYVDGELSAAATAAADAHRRECPSCDGAVKNLLEMRRALKEVAVAVPVPSMMESRVRAATTPFWQRPISRGSSISHAAAFGLVALVALAVFIAATTRPALGVHTANAMDRAALRLDDSSPVVVEGTVLCRDCELERRYGIKSSCPQIGHHGAIFTADGRILNLVEQRASAPLIHDQSLFGKKVVVHGRLFRGARALVVETYQVES